MGFAAQPGPADDAAERHEQPQPLRADRGQDVTQPVDLGRESPPERGHVKAAQGCGLIAARTVHQSRHRSQLSRDSGHRLPHLIRIGNIRPAVTHGHAGFRHPPQVRGQLRILLRVRAPQDRQPGTAVSGDGQRALSGDALAAAGHQQHIGVIQRRPGAGRPHR